MWDYSWTGVRLPSAPLVIFAFKSLNVITKGELNRRKVSVSGRRMLDVQIDAGPHFFLYCVSIKKEKIR